MIPVPSLILLVTAPAIPKAMNWSCVRQYSSGSGGAFGFRPHGVSRLVGIWLCSGNQIDSKPRSSASLAKIIGLIALSVGNMFMPKSVIVGS